VTDELRKLTLGIGTVRFDEPMANHTTLRVGGPADVFVEPNNLDELRRALALAREHDQSVTIIGGGSNLLITEAGVRGLVVRLGHGFETLRFDEGTVSAGAATSLTRLVRECARNGLAGLEFAIGIPGTVGGAVFGNAGAGGGEVGASAERVRCVTLAGDLRDFTREEAGFRYRGSALGDGVVVEVTFPQTRGDAETLSQHIRESLARRKATQPIDKMNAGCIFKNTPLGPAGKLIEQMGGKGMRVGAAVVSALHANFILNEGGASAAEVLELIAQVRARFREHYGCEVETEIRQLGEEREAGHE